MPKTTTPTKLGLPVSLTEEQREELRSLGALGWSPDDIAVYFGWDRSTFRTLTDDPDSEVSLLMLRGRLEKRARLELRLMDDAIAGDVASAKQLSEVMRDKSFEVSKLDIFGAPADDGAFERLRDYIAQGCPGTLSTNEQLYIDLLVMIYSLDGQYGKRKTIRFLTQQPFGFSYERAAALYAEATEMFFANRKVSKEALRAKFAERFDTLYALTMASAKTPKDYETAGNLLMQQAKVLRLDQPDPETLPAEKYQKQYRLLSLTPEAIGLPPANRDVLAAQIDEMLLPEREKRRLRMEGGIEDVDIIEILENVAQEESNSR